VFVKVIVQDPAEIPVTRPDADTVATSGADVDHGFTSAGEFSPVSRDVDPTQILSEPDIVHCACNFTNDTKANNKIQAILFISQWFSSQDLIFS
jgi:hypothetical protein